MTDEETCCNFGYFAVAFALGIKAVGAGMTALDSTLMSLFNLTSAGEAAAIALIGAGTTYVELAFTQLVDTLLWGRALRCPRLPY